MAQTSFALMTNLGRAKEAAALANATTIEVTQVAIGDGATVPSGGESALYHELARKTISGHGTVSGAANVAYFDCYLAAGDGPYTIREAGLYDVDGDLIAIAHYDPPINKPVPESGQTVEGTVRLEVAFSNVANVTIVVDPTMQVALQRLTQLPWIVVKELGRNDPPVAPVPGDIYVIGSSPTGAWAGNAGKVAEYTLAGWALLSPREGHGVSTPDASVYTRRSGAYVRHDATKTFRGLVELATAEEVQAGTDDERAITPAGLRAVLPSGSRVSLSFSETYLPAPVSSAQTLVPLLTSDPFEGGANRRRDIFVQGTIRVINGPVTGEIGYLRLQRRVDGGSWLEMLPAHSASFGFMLMNESNPAAYTESTLLFRASDNDETAGTYEYRVVGISGGDTALTFSKAVIYIEEIGVQS